MTGRSALETIGLLLTGVLLGGAGAWVYRDKVVVEQNLEHRDKQFEALQAAVPDITKQVLRLDRLVTRQQAMDKEFASHAVLLEKLSDCPIPDELRLLAEARTAEINASTEPPPSGATALRPKAK